MLAGRPGPSAPRSGSETPSMPAPLVSVIVPVLDESRSLPDLLDHLAGLNGRFEVLVVDGGSSDQTVAIARAHPLVHRVLERPPGRAGQLNAGAAEARGEVLLFVHADSRLPTDAYGSLRAACSDPSIIGGNFELRFEGDDWFAWALAAVYRSMRRLGYYYGDSSIFVRTAIYEELRGFRALPIMDDYDLARRLERRGQTACLPGPALTSARRWRRYGIPRTVASWLVIWALYEAGVPPVRLAGLYRHAR